MRYIWPRGASLWPRNTCRGYTAAVVLPGAEKEGPRSQIEAGEGHYRYARMARHDGRQYDDIVIICLLSTTRKYQYISHCEACHPLAGPSSCPGVSGSKKLSMLLKIFFEASGDIGSPPSPAGAQEGVRDRIGESLPAVAVVPMRNANRAESDCNRLVSPTIRRIVFMWSGAFLHVRRISDSICARSDLSAMAPFVSLSGFVVDHHVSRGRLCVHRKQGNTG